jgi:hypothetical protein
MTAPHFGHQRLLRALPSASSAIQQLSAKRRELEWELASVRALRRMPRFAPCRHLVHPAPPNAAHTHAHLPPAWCSSCFGSICGFLLWIKSRRCSSCWLHTTTFPRAPAPPHRPSPHALLQRLSTLLTSTLQAMARYVGPGDGPGDKSSGSGLDKAAMADSAVSLAVWLVVGGGGVDWWWG